MAILSEKQFKRKEELRLQKRAVVILRRQMEYIIDHLNDMGFKADDVTVPAFFREREVNTLKFKIERMLEFLPGDDDMAEAVVAAMSSSTLQGAKKTIRTLRLDKYGISFSLKNPRVVKMLEDRRQLELSERLGSIGHTTRSRIHDILVKGADEGLSYQKMGQMIRQQAVDGVFSVARGELIAVTEVGRAYGQGQVEVSKEFLSRYPDRRIEKRWITAGDSAVREEHRANQAAGWIDFQENFPGTDEFNAPSADFRCRCTYQERIADDKNAPQATVEVADDVLDDNPMDDIRDSIDGLQEQVKAVNSALVTTKVVDKSVEDVENKMVAEMEALAYRFDNSLQSIQLLPGEKGDKGDPGEPGKDGRDGVDGKDGADSTVPGPQGEKGDPGADGSPDEPKQIVAKLESLKGKDRLSAKAIKDLSKYVAQNQTIIGGGGGAVAFPQLVDVPHAYNGQTGKVVAVKSTEDGLEFITPNPGDITSVVAGDGISGGGTSGDVTITNSDRGSTAVSSHVGESDPHTQYVEKSGDTMTGVLTINTNSTTALKVEQDGVKDNVLVVDTTNGRVSSLSFVGDGNTAAILGAGLKSPYTNTVVVDQGGKGNYTTIKAACDYVNTQTRNDNNRWVIYVMAGTYNETAFTVPTYTTVHGMGALPVTGTIGAVLITSATDVVSGNFITLSQYAYIENVYLNFTVGATQSAPVTGIYQGDGSGIVYSYIFINAFSATQTVYSVRGYIGIGNTTILPFGTTSIGICTDIFAGTIVYSYIYNLYGAGIIGFKNTTGTTTLIGCEFRGDGTHINRTGGTVNIIGGSYRTSSGTITHLDRIVPNNAHATWQAGASTQIVQILKGAVSQTANLTEWQDSSGTVLGSIGNESSTWITSFARTLSSSSAVGGLSLTANNSGTGGLIGLNFTATRNTASGSASYVRGIYGVAQVTGGAANYTACLGLYVTSAFGSTGTLTNLRGAYIIANISAGNGVVTDGYGIDIALAINSGATAGATIGNGSAIRATINNYKAGTTITNAYGLNLSAWSNVGTVSNSYGIYADASIDIGGTRYFIYSLSTSPSLLTGQLTAPNFISTVATGTQPIAVTSTTVNTNLNADMVDDKHVGTSGNTIPLLDGANTWSADQTISDKDIILGTTTGTKIGTATSQKLAFYNSTPVVQQTGVAAQKTDYTAGDLDTEAKIITALNTTNAAINTLRTALNNLGLTSTI